MERSPFSQSENSESNDKDKDKKSNGFRVAPVRIPGFNEVRPEPPAERPRAVAPLEGIISWREREDEIKHDLIRHDEGTKEQKDEDQEEDTSKQHERKSHVRGESSYAGEVTRPINVPRPVAEIFAEQQRLRAAQEAEVVEAESSTEDDKEDTSKKPAPLPEPDFRPNTERADTAPEHDDQYRTELDEDQQPPKIPQPDFAPPQQLASFPEVTPRTTSQPEQEASFSEPYQEQAQEEDESQQVPPNQTQPPFAYLPPQPGRVNGVNNLNQPPTQPQINPNNQNIPINPAAWNQLPATPNVLPQTPAAGANMPPGTGGPNQFGGNMGGQPPYNPNGGYNGMPFGPNNPNFGYNAQPSPDQSQSMPMAPAMPIERPVPTSNRDPRVGPIAALLGLEYFARKRADRKLEKRMRKDADERQRQHEQQIQANDLRMQERNRQFEAEQRRQADQLRQLNQTQQEFAGQSQPMTYADRQPGGLPTPFESAPMASAASNGPRQEFVPGAPFAAPMRAEGTPQAQANAANVQRMNTMPGSSELQQATPQQSEQQQAQTAQEYDPRKAHVEQSSWHNIVVDEHGREVVGAMQYGEGFKREQKEIVSSHTSDSSSQAAGRPLPGGGGSAGSAGSGGATFAQASNQQVAYDQYGRPVHMQHLPSGMTNPTLPAGQPTHIDPQHQLPAVNPHQSNLTNPWFWVMILLIIAAFFTAALI